MLRILLDEDSKSKSLIALLRSVGYEVVTTADLGIDGASDEEVLEAARKHTLSVLTHNCDDYRKLHNINGGHFGIFVVYQSKQSNMSFIEVLRALRNLGDSGHEIAGNLHILNDWNFQRID